MSDHVAGQEEYLEHLYRLSPGGQVSLASLARSLSVKPPSVTEMCQALARKGLVVYVPRRGVTLTESGRGEGRRLVRRHRLAERLLTDMVGLPWEQAHEEACKYEHVIGDEVERLLAQALPTTCPHGNPIDDQPSGADGATPLTHLAPGAVGEVVRIEREETEVLRYLAQLGLIPGTSVRLINRAPFGGPVLLMIGDAHYAVSRDIAERVIVKEGGDSAP